MSTGSPAKADVDPQVLAAEIGAVSAERRERIKVRAGIFSTLLAGAATVIAAWAVASATKAQRVASETEKNTQDVVDRVDDTQRAVATIEGNVEEMSKYLPLRQEQLARLDFIVARRSKIEEMLKDGPLIGPTCMSEAYLANLGQNIDCESSAPVLWSQLTGFGVGRAVWLSPKFGQCWCYLAQEPAREAFDELPICGGFITDHEGSLENAVCNRGPIGKMITTGGQIEWDRPEYTCYCDEEAPTRPPNKAAAEQGVDQPDVAVPSLPAAK